MKKNICVMLALILLAGQSAFAAVDSEISDPVWRAENSGYTLRIPDAYREADGFISFSDGGDLFDQGSGIVSSSLLYTSATEEAYKALTAEINTALYAEDFGRVEELQGILDKTEYPLANIYGISRGRGEEELRAFLKKKNLGDVPEELTEEQEALLALMQEHLNTMRFSEIGSKDGMNYFLSQPSAESVKMLYTPEDGDAYFEEYCALLGQPELILDNITLVGGVSLSKVAEIGSEIRFETTDLDGNPVTSAEIFAGHPVTMINMWATWCDPCKAELPALAKMSGEFAAKGVRFLGLCLDAEDEETMAEARDILANAGVEYLNIAPFEGREDMLPNKSYPTTYFVDENGIVLTAPAVGAALSQYPEVLDRLLSVSD